jgi:hypothetical protein
VVVADDWAITGAPWCTATVDVVVTGVVGSVNVFVTGVVGGVDEVGDDDNKPTAPLDIATSTPVPSPTVSAPVAIHE